MEEKITIPQIEHTALIRFFQEYPPVLKFTEANLFYTTEELLSLLKSNDASFMMTSADLMQWLLKSGYKTGSIGGCKMIWLLYEE